MTEAIRPLIAGNWKMNGLKASMAEFEAMLAGAAAVADRADLLVCPPATLIAGFAATARGSSAASKTLSIGAQDCHPKASGAHTGDISAEMLADAGARAGDDRDLALQTWHAFSPLYRRPSWRDGQGGSRAGHRTI